MKQVAIKIFFQFSAISIFTLLYSKYLHIQFQSPAFSHLIKYTEIFIFS